MMEKLNNIFTKEYITGIDQQGKLQKKELNLFQIFLRNVFGQYQETHYQNATKFVAKCLQNKETPLSPNDVLIIKQFFNKNRNLEESKSILPENCILYQLKKDSFKLTCSLKSLSLCELRIEDKYTAILLLKVKDPTTLEVYDSMSSDALKESDPIYTELFNFLINTLNQSTKFEQIIWKNPPEKFVKSAENLHYNQDEEGNSIVAFKRTPLTNERQPSLSLNFLLEFTDS